MKLVYAPRGGAATTKAELLEYQKVPVCVLLSSFAKRLAMPGILLKLKAAFDQNTTELQNDDSGAIEALNTLGYNSIDWLGKKILCFSLSRHCKSAEPKGSTLDQTKPQAHL